MAPFVFFIPFLVVPVLLIVGFVLLVIFARRGGRTRESELRALAKSWGMWFSPSRAQGFEDRFPRFDRLRQGDDRYAYHLMDGDWAGRRFLAFDYHYETTSKDSDGKTKTTDHYFSAVVLWSAVPLQPLSIRPEGFFDRVAAFFGADDIDFESAEFSRRFHVTAQDKRWAYDVIHQRTMEFLLGMPDFTIQFDYQYVIAYRAMTFQPAEFHAAAEVIRGILDRLPDYVVRQQRASESRLGESAPEDADPSGTSR